MNGSKSAIVMSKTRPNILYAAVCIHPHFVKDDWNDKSLDQLEDMVKLPECVAVGECGLDYKRDYSPHELKGAKLNVPIRKTYPLRSQSNNDD